MLALQKLQSAYRLNHSVESAGTKAHNYIKINNCRGKENTLVLLVLIAETIKWISNSELLGDILITVSRVLRLRYN